MNSLEAWKTVDLRRTAKGRPPDLGRIPLPKLYITPRPIKDVKKADLFSLFDFIPPVYHAFYNGLLSSSDGNNEDSKQSDSEESDQEEDEGEQSDGDSEQDNELSGSNFNHLTWDHLVTTNKFSSHKLITNHSNSWSITYHGTDYYLSMILADES